MSNKMNFKEILRSIFRQSEVQVSLLIGGKYCDNVWSHVYDEVTDKIFDQIEQPSMSVSREVINGE